MTKRKDERRELLKEDELLSGMEKVAHYIQEKPKQVLVLSLAILVALAVIFGAQAMSRQGKLSAAGDLYKAEKILDTDLKDEKAELKFDSEKARYEAALAEIEKVLNSNSGIVKQQATLLKIRCLSNLGRSEEVLPLYVELAANGGNLKFFGVKGQADYHFAKKDYEKAIGFYQEMKKLDGVSDELADYRIAVCHKENGKKDEARKILEDLVEKYKDKEAMDRPPISMQAEQLLTELKDGENSAG